MEPLLPQLLPTASFATLRFSLWRETVIEKEDHSLELKLKQTFAHGLNTRFLNLV